MLKLHKGLKKKKKDKKHKHKKEDDLFTEEELEKYRKEHQSGTGENSVQNDEWQKFKALTKGVDTVLQKTQEDLDRIKSTSFFQRKATASEVEKQKEEERKQEEEKALENEAACNSAGDHQTEENRLEEAALEKLSESEEESEVDDTLFDTSYVDAVASGELKLAYIPDSPIEEVSEFDPFDTSIADKFIETNPKKRYLNLGCAVQVLSGRGVAENSVPVPVFEKKSQRRRVKPVDLLFDEGDQTPSDIQKEKTPIDSPPTKTLLDEDDPTFEKTDIDIFSLPPAPVLHVPTPVVPQESEKEKLDLSEFELNDLTPLPCTNAVAVLEKQPSSESTDDEFALLAAESLAKKSSITPVDPQPPAFREQIKSFDQISPTESIPVNPLQPQTVTDEKEEAEIDPFDTSIVEKLILPGKQEIKLLEKELLNDVKQAPAPKKVVDDIDDNDFDPRAGEVPVQVIRPQDLRIAAVEARTVFDKTPSQREDFLKIEEHEIEIAKPLTPLTENCQKTEEEEEEEKEYDPFDTSHVCHAPGKSELKLIEKELIHESDPLQDDDFDPRKYESETNSSNVTSITHSILNKYACAAEEKTESVSEPVTVDILTGEDEHPIDIPHSPVEPEKFVSDSPELEYIDPFDTSIADNIQPGKVELKILETELISEN